MDIKVLLDASPALLATIDRFSHALLAQASAAKGVVTFAQETSRTNTGEGVTVLAQSAKPTPAPVQDQSTISDAEAARTELPGADKDAEYSKFEQYLEMKKALSDLSKLNANVAADINKKYAPGLKAWRTFDIVPAYWGRCIKEVSEAFNALKTKGIYLVDFNLDKPVLADDPTETPPAAQEAPELSVEDLRPLCTKAKNAGVDVPAILMSIANTKRIGEVPAGLRLAIKEALDVAMEGK